MSVDSTTGPTRSTPDVATAVTVVGKISSLVAAIGLGLLLLIIIAEAVARYFFAAPLGWNVSMVERLLMPGIVFLSLPWMYTAAGHVSAGMLYERFPASAQKAARWLSLCVIVIGAVMLFVGGLSGTVSSFMLGEKPPPGSNDVAIPTWMWLAVQPVGAGALLFVVLADARRFIGFGENEGSGEFDDESQTINEVSP